MLKKLLIALVLLTGSANANFFEALKDAAAKAIEEQNRLNNTVEGNSPALADQAPTPKFNSLAEEAAYKKRQEEERQMNDKEKERKFQENMISNMKNLRAKRTSYYDKYFVKKTDSKEMIEAKYANRTQLVKEMQNDRTILKFEAQKIDQMLRNSQYNLSEHHKVREFEDAFPDRIEHSDEINYVFAYDDPNTDGLARYITDENQYALYLKYAYNSYDTRQAALAEAKANQIKAQKEQQAKLDNEQKERKKVQQACQVWKKQINKQVHSLGIGDQIVTKAGMIYIIRGVEANTFLINAGGVGVYVQKSECIPYSSIRTAPSKYCYQ